MTSSVLFPLLVGLGGFAGSIVRYGLSIVSQRFAVILPFGTLMANILGCLLVGVITSLSTHGELIPTYVRLATATGFCGGFTTMSSMIYETAEMLRASEYLHAATYVFGSVVISLIAFFLGFTAVRILMSMGGGLWS